MIRIRIIKIVVIVMPERSNIYMVQLTKWQCLINMPASNIKGHQHPPQLISACTTGLMLLHELSMFYCVNLIKPLHQCSLYYIYLQIVCMLMIVICKRFIKLCVLRQRLECSVYYLLPLHSMNQSQTQDERAYCVAIRLLLTRLLRQYIF